MTYIILISICVGIISGKFFLDESFLSNLDSITTFSLNLLLLSVGIDIGFNKEVFKDLKQLGVKILLVPLSIIVGSLIGGFACSLIFKMPLNESFAIASGYGWYSLSAVLISQMGNPIAGAIAFLSNVFRELLAVIAIPFIAKKLNFITAIAPAGATSMDSTLPVISASTDKKTIIISFINGAILSALVPIVVPFFYNLF